MKQETKDRILRVIEANHGYLRTGELIRQGISNAYLKVLVADGLLTQLKRGLYRLSAKQVGDSLMDVQAIVPSGIFCLGTALEHYGLTTYVPGEYHVAIESKDKIRLPEYPPIRLFYYDSETFPMGMEEKVSEDMTYRIYSRERTLCDAVKFRNKIGKDIVLESIRNYMKLPEKNLQKLYEYARKLRVEKLMGNYLEILV